VGYLCEAFYPDGEWTTQRRFQYDSTNKRRYYKVDCSSEKERSVWEYDGPQHYANIFKIKNDEERDRYLRGLGYRVRRWPFFLQLTRDVAQFFFAEAFNEKAYGKALDRIYEGHKEDQILAPGFHKTTNTPANFVSRGINRFLNEVSELPISTKDQIAHSLQIYVEEVKDRDLVMPEGSELEDFYHRTIDKSNLDLLFTRKN
jgi:hypothetical protein